MLKRFCLVVLMISAALSAFSQQDKPVITVMDFKVNGVSEAEMKSIIDLLSSAMFRTNFFTVIDVSQRETVLKELQFSMSGCTDESCMLEIGKMLAAEGIVVGSIGRVGSKYVLAVKLLETETGKTLSTADGIYANLDELLEDTAGLAARLSAPYGTVADTTGGGTAGSGATSGTAPREKKEREPARINVPAVVTLAGAVGCLGAGGYFLAVSLPLLMAFTDAQNAYTAGDADLGDDLTALYNAYETARAAAVDGNANTNFIIGASAAGVGVGLGVLSAILFAKSPAAPAAPEAAAVSGMIIPLPGAMTLSFRLRL